MEVLQNVSTFSDKTNEWIRKKLGRCKKWYRSPLSMIRLALRSHGATGQKFWCFIGSIRLRYSEVDFYGFHHTGATRCTDESWTWRERVDGWLHAKSLSDDSWPLIIQNNVTLERYNPWPHVANRHISTSQLLPLWHHSHYDAAPIPIMTSFSLWHYDISHLRRS